MDQKGGWKEKTEKIKEEMKVNKEDMEGSNYKVKKHSDKKDQILSKGENRERREGEIKSEIPFGGNRRPMETR